MKTTRTQFCLVCSFFSIFTCEKHFFSFLEHHVTAGTPGTAGMVTLPPSLQTRSSGRRKEVGKKRSQLPRSRSRRNRRETEMITLKTNRGMVGNRKKRKQWRGDSFILSLNLSYLKRNSWAICANSHTFWAWSWWIESRKCRFVHPPPGDDYWPTHTFKSLNLVEQKHPPEFWTKIIFWQEVTELQPLC